MRAVFAELMTSPRASHSDVVLMPRKLGHSGARFLGYRLATSTYGASASSSVDTRSVIFVEMLPTNSSLRVVLSMPRVP